MAIWSWDMTLYCYLPAALGVVATNVWLRHNAKRDE